MLWFWIKRVPVALLLLLPTFLPADSAAARWRLVGGAGPGVPWSADAFQEGLKTGISATLGAGYDFGSGFEIISRAAYSLYQRDNAGVLSASPLPQQPTRILQMSGGSMSVREIQTDLRFFPSQGNPAGATHPYLLGAAGVVLHRYEQVEIVYAWAGHTWAARVPRDRGTNLGLGLGAGVKFDLNNQLSLEVESRYSIIVRGGEDLHSVPVWVQLAFSLGAQ